MPSVFSGDCAWRVMSFTLDTVIIDVERLTPEMFIIDVIVANESPASSHVPYMTTAVPMYKRGNLSTIAKSPKKHRQNIATAPTTAVMKEEDVLDVIKAAESLHLPPETGYPGSNAVRNEDGALFLRGRF